MATITIKGAKVLIDDQDLPRVSDIRWHMSDGYAKMNVRNNDGTWRKVGMHRFILGDACSQVVDHINRDKLDNRRCNLRGTTQSFNCRNIPRRKNKTSLHRGVSWNAGKSAWQVVVREHGNLKWKGYYASEDEAARIAAPYFAGIAL